MNYTGIGQKDFGDINFKKHTLHKALLVYMSRGRSYYRPINHL